MNKNKIVLSAIGGVALVASAVVGYLLWSACDEKSDMESELEGAKERVQRANSAKIAPTQASVDAIESNRKMLDAWRAEAVGAASAGDLAVDAAVTPEAFKRTMVDDARKLAKLPGAADGRIVKDGFGFGFKDYITGGSMPERAKLAAMQRQWREVKSFVETLAECGAAEILDITVAAEAAPAEEAKAPQRGAKRPARAKDDGAERKDEVSAQSYVVKFLARPPALVGALNAFATCERFVAVDSCSFARADDTLAAMLGGKDKKEGPRASARAGRRGRRPAAEESKEGEEESKRKGIVTDPEIDLPFTVTLKMTTFDFGKATAAAKPSADDGKEKDDSKEKEEEE